MRFLKRRSIALAVALVAIALPAAAAAKSFTGSWPITITDSKHSNETGCLTLTDYGGGSGSKHSGSASLVLGGSKFSYGTFQVFNRTLVATIEAQGYGQNAGLVFIGSAKGGAIGPGVYDEVYGGEAFDEGALAFGARNGC